MTVDEALIRLHVEYRSGGEAPLGFLWTYFEDGTVRYYSPRGKVRWAELSATDAAELESLLESTELRAELARLRRAYPAFGCCDYEEVGIALGVDQQMTGYALEATADENFHVIARLLELVDELGRRYFGRHYGLRLPLDGMKEVRD